MSSIFSVRARRSGFLLLAINLSACNTFPAVDLAPDYQPAQFVVPDSWHGSSPFVEAKPSDGELRKDWWTVFDDPVLNKLEEQGMAANPDLQAAAERFVQVRDMMLKARSRLIPHLGLGFGASDNKESANGLFKGADNPIYDSSVAGNALASWEPDFWSAIRNKTRIETYRAEQSAAEYGLARLSLQAEIAANYFTLRGYDAQEATYRQSIEYYKMSLAIVTDQYLGEIASELDVARAEYLLSSTQAKELDIKSKRQVTEHALAILVNMAPASFSVEPVDELKITNFSIPQKIPATLLERRPDIAGMERQMAQANRAIGIARAAFYPNVVFQAGGGYENHSFDIISLANSLWSYGSSISLPVFEGGYRRAQLQQSWSAYRETEDKYRSTVLNAFREVENGLSLTKLLNEEVERQESAVGAALKAQDLTMELYKGGLNSSLDLIYAQVNTLTARITAVEVKTGLLQSSVGLIRSLGGGWSNKELPTDDQIQPFGVLQYSNLNKPQPAGGIDVNADNNAVNNDLTKPAAP
ncbi:MAG: efflux transporter outer membrane subunit [Methylococcales bacterium]|nr:efflux transporter outer membrane subunit [Methylococcales bacterium]